MSAGLVLSGCYEGDPVASFPLDSGDLLQSLAFLACRCLPQSSAFILTWHSLCVNVSLSRFPHSVKMQLYCMRTHPNVNPRLNDLNLIILFPNKVTLMDIIVSSPNFLH